MPINNSVLSSALRGFGVEELERIAIKLTAAKSGFIGLNSRGEGSPIVSKNVAREAVAGVFKIDQVLGGDPIELNVAPNNGGSAIRYDTMHIPITFYKEQHLVDTIVDRSYLLDYPGVSRAVQAFQTTLFQHDEKQLITSSISHVPGGALPTETAPPLFVRNVAGSFPDPSRAFFSSLDTSRAYKTAVAAAPNATFENLIGGLGYNAGTLQARKMSANLISNAVLWASMNENANLPIPRGGTSGLPEEYKGLTTNRYALLMSPTDFSHLLEDPMVSSILSTGALQDSHSLALNRPAEYRGCIHGVEIWVNQYLEWGALRVGNQGNVYLGHSLLIGANAWGMVRGPSMIDQTKIPEGMLCSFIFASAIRPFVSVARYPGYVGGIFTPGIMSVFTQRSIGGGLNIAVN